MDFFFFFLISRKCLIPLKIHNTYMLNTTSGEDSNRPTVILNIFLGEARQTPTRGGDPFSCSAHPPTALENAYVHCSCTPFACV